MMSCTCGVTSTAVTFVVTAVAVPPYLYVPMIGTLPALMVGASATWDVEIPMPEMAIAGVWPTSYS
jgi:hypothetical protein